MAEDCKGSSLSWFIVPIIIYSLKILDRDEHKENIIYFIILCLLKRKENNVFTQIFISYPDLIYLTKHAIVFAIIMV
jgi:hypothetical protein